MKIKAFIFTLCLTFPVLANALTPEQAILINQQITRYENNVKMGDLGAIYAQMPPKMIDDVAKQLGRSVSQFLQESTKLGKVVYANIEILDFEYHLSEGKTGMTAYRQYVIIPHLTKWKVGGQPFTLTEYLLIFSDNQKWYLTRLNNQQHIDIDLIKMSYPDLMAINSLK